MNSAILDTSVASLMFRNSPDFAPYKVVLAEYTPVISFQTVAEMRLGATLAQWGTQRQSELETFLDDFDICAFSDELATCWAEVMADSRRVGRRLEAGDAWIAATAKLYNAPLLTHDKDFALDAVPSITVYRFI